MSEVKSASPIIKDQDASMYFNALDSLSIELTNKCNLQCVHCYADSGPGNPIIENMTTSQYIEILNEALLLGCRRVQFIGGEPLLYPDLLKLLTHASNIGYQSIEVYTNGTLLYEKICRDFARLGVRVAVSVYANQKSIHEAITKRSGSFSKTINGIQKALEYGITLRVGIIEMQENRFVTENTRIFLNSIGVQNIHIDKIRRIGRGASLEQDSNPLDELCGACWQGQLAIAPNGDIFPCVLSRFHKVGNISEGLQYILNKRELGSFREVIRSGQYSLSVSGKADPCSPDNCSPCTPTGPDKPLL